MIHEYYSVPPFLGRQCDEAYVQASVAAEEQRVAALCAELGITVLLGTTGQRGGQLHNDVLVLNERGKTLGRYSTQTSQGWPRV